jgi:glycosyltransferase involved in cell wall biosynthesis
VKENNSMNNISVIIIAGNEEENIRDCLESVKWADETIVVDSESTDNTVEIAKTYTEKVFIRTWNGYSDQQKYALSKVSNDLVLSIDADERVTTELTDYILNKDLNVANGYFIRRDNYFLDNKIHGCGWDNDYQMRLFKKSEVSVTDRLVHGGFVVAGKSMKIHYSIVHYTGKSLHQALEKTNEYSSLLSREKAGSKIVGFTSLAFEPIIALYQHFIARKGYKDGVYGFLVSLFHAITKLQELAKIWEINRNAKSK